MRQGVAMTAGRMRSALAAAVAALGLDRSGATALEYALIAVLISIVCVGWATFTGASISGFMVSVAGGL